MRHDQEKAPSPSRGTVGRGALLLILLAAAWAVALPGPVAAQGPELGCCLPASGGGYLPNCVTTTAVNCQRNIGGLVVASCDPPTPPCPTPPANTFGCCVGGGCADLPIVSIEDLASCQASGGTPVSACNAGGTCPPLGACCITGLGCTITNSAGCTGPRVGGTYLGNGTTCGTNTCAPATTTTTTTTTTTSTTTTTMPGGTTTTTTPGSTTTTMPGGTTTTTQPRPVPVLPGGGPAALALLLSLGGFFILLRRSHGE